MDININLKKNRECHFTKPILNNGVADLTIPFTNRLSEFIILLLKLNTKVGMFISGEIEKKKKKKKKVIRANLKLFHVYFATSLVENIIFSAIF